MPDYSTKWKRMGTQPASIVGLIDKGLLATMFAMSFGDQSELLSGTAVPTLLSKNDLIW